jgi:hypothetical protein
MSNPKRIHIEGYQNSHTEKDIIQFLAPYVRTVLQVRRLMDTNGDKSENAVAEVEFRDGQQDRLRDLYTRHSIAGHQLSFEPYDRNVHFDPLGDSIEDAKNSLRALETTRYVTATNAAVLSRPQSASRRYTSPTKQTMRVPRLDQPGTREISVSISEGGWHATGEPEPFTRGRSRSQRRASSRAMSRGGSPTRSPPTDAAPLKYHRTELQPQQHRTRPAVSSPPPIFPTLPAQPPGLKPLPTMPAMHPLLAPESLVLGFVIPKHVAELLNPTCFVNVCYYDPASRNLHLPPAPTQPAMPAALQAALLQQAACSQQVQPPPQQQQQQVPQRQQPAGMIYGNNRRRGGRHRR